MADRQSVVASLFHPVKRLGDLRDTFLFSHEFQDELLACKVDRGGLI